MGQKTTPRPAGGPSASLRTGQVPPGTLRQRPVVVAVQELAPVEPLRGCGSCGCPNRVYAWQCDGCGAPMRAPTLGTRAA